ncbi:MAG TPA: hypothetical protein DDW52_13475 [Planctomycetaceae bacterium]|nr:hypothetical protein [Planctomycetaceae bacterium]
MTIRYPGMKPNLTAAEINRWNETADQALNGDIIAPKGDSLSSQGTWVWIKNTTGGTVSRFQTLALGSEVFTLDLDGSVDLIFTAVSADPDEQPCVLIDTIGDGELGRAIIHGLAYAITESGTGNFAEPAATNKLSPSSSGSIQLLTAATGAETLCAVLLGVGTEGGDTHYLYTLTSPMSGGSGTAEIRDMLDGSQVSASESVRDTLGQFDGLPTGARGICIAQGGDYFAIGPYVTGVRWNDPNLEYSKDGGSSHTNIDTAEDCS